MSGIKRERDEDVWSSDTGDGLPSKKPKYSDGCDDDDDGTDTTPRAIGRVRKKSAKVLEMEEFEEAEKKQLKKTPLDSSKKHILAPVTPGPTPGSVKKPKIKTDEETVKVEDTPIVIAEEPILPPEPKNIPDSTTPPTKSTKSSVIKLLLSSPAVPTTPSVSTKAVTKSKPTEVHTESENMGVTQSTKKAIKSKVKIKDMTTPLMLSPSIVPLHIETVPDIKSALSLTPESLTPLTPTSAIYANMPEIDSISPAPIKDGSLKMKLILSPKQESMAPIPEFNIPGIKNMKKTKKKKKTLPIPTEPTSSSKSPSEAMPNLAALVNASNPGVLKKKSQLKKKNMKKLEYEFETLADGFDPIDKDEEPHLVIAETTTDKKNPVKKKFSGKIKKKVKPEANTSDIMKDNSVPPEGDIAALSAKVTKQVGKKKKTVSEFLKKPKKNKRPPTAYTLWCNAHRNEVLKENPKMDFAQMSRRLGVIWQGLSKKEKMSWKRKAKKLAGKGSTLISTGKLKSSVSVLPTPASSAPSTQLSTSVLKNPVQVIPANKKNPTDDPVVFSLSRGLGTDPVDVAAHLKLMGESLSNIGMRLQETKGHMAVQGGLSVLLDSLICACGPLMCLTQQLWELNGCDRNTHAKTLDNIAYIMPGL